MTDRRPDPKNQRRALAGRPGVFVLLFLATATPLACWGPACLPGPCKRVEIDGTLPARVLVELTVCRNDECFRMTLYAGGCGHAAGLVGPQVCLTLLEGGAEMRLDLNDSALGDAARRATDIYSIHAEGGPDDVLLDESWVVTYEKRTDGGQVCPPCASAKVTF